MELQNKDDIRNEILQTWLRSAWVYPFEGPDVFAWIGAESAARWLTKQQYEHWNQCQAESAEDDESSTPAEAVRQGSSAGNSQHTSPGEGHHEDGDCPPALFGRIVIRQERIRSG